MRFIRTTLLLAAASLAMPGTAGAAADQPHQLKAAIVFNILRFVDFADSGASDQVRLCLPRDVAGRSALASLDGRVSGSRRIVVRATAPGVGQGCDAIYVGSAGMAEIQRLERDGLLIIGDGPSFVRAGGTIGLVSMGNQVRFEVNNKAARSNRIAISSKLLRLAARIEQ